MTDLKDLYDQDYHAWTQETAKALREKDLKRLDIEHLIEEVESLGASERRALESYLVVLLTHLLKWKYQPGMQSSSWKGSIVYSRLEIIDLIKDNPSLKKIKNELLERSYRKAYAKAIIETGLGDTIFPSSCPWGVEEVLDETFFP